jgi:hypothetical protein
VVEAIKSKFEEVLIVPSNHDDMLNRYLESGDWVHDSRNAAIANVLFGYALRGANPLEELFKAEGVKFLDENSHEAIAGFVVSEHGHRAVGGAKGSAAGFRRCAPHVVGHSHAPKARSNFLQTGCICKLRQGYNKGLSDWAHAVVNLYEDQQWELIIIINGKFTGMTL